MATGHYGEERAVTLRGALNYYWEPRLAARTTADEAIQLDGLTAQMDAVRRFEPFETWWGSDGFCENFFLPAVGRSLCVLPLVGIGSPAPVVQQFPSLGRSFPKMMVQRGALLRFRGYPIQH